MEIVFGDLEAMCIPAEGGAAVARAKRAFDHLAILQLQQQELLEKEQVSKVKSN